MRCTTLAPFLTPFSNKTFAKRFARSSNCCHVISRLLLSAGILSIRATSSGYILLFLANISAMWIYIRAITCPSNSYSITGDLLFSVRSFVGCPLNSGGKFLLNIRESPLVTYHISPPINMFFRLRQKSPCTNAGSIRDPEGQGYLSRSSGRGKRRFGR